MSEEKNEATQKTRPKKGEPIDIPIPSEEQVARDFLKVATATRDDDDGSEEPEPNPPTKDS